MRKTRSVLATAVIVAGLTTLASPAGALPVGGGNPPDPTDRPDLKLTALSVSPVGNNWAISYTVANGGQLAAGPSQLAFNGGAGVSTVVSLTSLAAGTSRSGSLQVARPGPCFVYLYGTVDSAKTVTESNESNNTRTAVGVVPPCPPRYKITASSFHAVEESGIDGAGSDEPYWIFSTVSNGGTASSRASQVYGGIDEGDTQVFAAADSCLWGCGAAGAEAPFGIGLSVQLWESDLGHVSDTLHDTADAFVAAGPILSAAGVPTWIGAATSAMGKAMDFILGWAEDDFMGSATYGYSADYLAAALPSRGMAFADTRTYSSDGATYTLTTSISRIV